MILFFSLSYYFSSQIENKCPLYKLHHLIIFGSAEYDLEDKDYGSEKQWQ